MNNFDLDNDVNYEEENGADLFAIGIGFPDVSGLKEIVGKADKVNSVGTYKDLGMKKIISDVLPFACRTVHYQLSSSSLQCLL